ncbi:transcriptional regulator [Lactobacillus sp. PFC-70]|nr:transcriptional regulator [Lactobacillus sp. PFC-70]
MEVELSETYLGLFKALASPVRIKIIQILARQPMNINELSQRLGLSKSIVSMHIQKLNAAGIISVASRPAKNGRQKISELSVNYIGIKLSDSFERAFSHYDVEMPVGHFTNCAVTPTCGLATKQDYIGNLDDPQYFMDPHRVEASILWFSSGFIEYKVPNFLKATQKLQQIDISMEISSEFPFANNNWPSDISFVLNNTDLGIWESPGDYNDRRGKLNPSWWTNNMNQYGLLKTLEITQQGTFMNGDKISEVTVKNFIRQSEYWNLTFKVEKTADHPGGLTIFGKDFGNHPQGIKFKFYYE